MSRLNFRRLPFEQCKPHGLKPFQCITEGVHFFLSCITATAAAPQTDHAFPKCLLTPGFWITPAPPATGTEVGCQMKLPSHQNPYFVVI